MSNKSYWGCTIVPAKLEFSIEFSSGNKALIKDAKFFADCCNLIDRQLAHLAILKILQGK